MSLINFIYAELNNSGSKCRSIKKEKSIKRQMDRPDRISTIDLHVSVIYYTTILSSNISRYITSPRFQCSKFTIGYPDNKKNKKPERCPATCRYLIESQKAVSDDHQRVLSKRKKSKSRWVWNGYLRNFCTKNKIKKNAFHLKIAPNHFFITNPKATVLKTRAGRSARYYGNIACSRELYSYVICWWVWCIVCLIVPDYEIPLDDKCGVCHCRLVYFRLWLFFWRLIFWLKECGYALCYLRCVCVGEIIMIVSSWWLNDGNEILLYLYKVLGIFVEKNLVVDFFLLRIDLNWDFHIYVRHN